MKSNKKDIFYGIQFDTEGLGDTNGTVKRIRYFECNRKMGRFVSLSDIRCFTASSEVESPRICIGDKVKCKNYDSSGTVMFIGNVYDDEMDDDIYFGIRLDEAKARGNGIKHNRRYFECEENCGVFLKATDLMVISGSIWTEYTESLLHENDKILNRLERCLEISDAMNRDVERPNQKSGALDLLKSDHNILESPALDPLKAGARSKRINPRRSRLRSHRGLAAVKAVAKASYETPGARSRSRGRSRSRSRPTNKMSVNASKIMQSAHCYQKKKNHRMNMKGTQLNQHQGIRSAVKSKSSKGVSLEIAKEWTMTNEDVMAVFDGDGNLRDEEEYERLKQIDAENGAMRRDWRMMRDMARNGNMDERVRQNWPLQWRRYEGPESLEYEAKMRRIKRQFLGIKPGSTDTAVEIIGDLDDEWDLKRFHPITFKGERAQKVVRKEVVTKKQNVVERGKDRVADKAESTKVVSAVKPKKRLIDYKKRNARSIMTMIEDLLETEMEEDGEEDADKFEDLKSKIYEVIWKKVQKKFKGADSKIDSQALKSAVDRLFPGVYAVL